MNEEHAIEHKDGRAVSHIKKHQFTTFLIVSITVALFMVYISLNLYQSSGTMPLDLSRPGFDKAREEATRDNTVFQGFSAEGDITSASLEEFSKLYTSKLNNATAIDAFGGDALSDKTLQLGTSSN